MGYLSQKKSQNRKSLFFKASSVVVLIWSFILIYNPNLTILKLNLFHLYLLSFILFLLSFIAHNYKTTFAFFVCYTNLSSSTNIFLSNNFSGRSSFGLFFSAADSTLNTTLEKTSSGTLILADDTKAHYTVVQTPQPLTLISINLNKTSIKKIPLVFKNLHQFIVSQDNPVIVVGEFGIPAWQKTFKQFLNDSGLKVKNRFIFTSGSKYNIFSTPTFYILGFREMGVSNITLTDSLNKTLSANISFNPILP